MFQTLNCVHLPILNYDPVLQPYVQCRLETRLYIHQYTRIYIYTNIQGYIYTKMIGQLVGLRDIGVLYATSVSMVSTHLTQVYSAESSLLAQ